MKTSPVFFLSLIVPLFFSASASYAGDSTVRVSSSNEIIISGTGYEKLLTSTPGGTGVMTEDKIMQKTPVSITDALQDITGVYESSDSAWGSELSIRGAGRDRVIMIIDGSRMNTSTDIGAQFGTINPASIEKVEVLKGPISSLYGSGTIGGVVNIFTRTGHFTSDPESGSGIKTSYETNSHGINTYGFSSYNSSNYYVFGSGSWRKHNNYSDGNGKEVENSGFNDVEGVVNLGFIPAPGNTIELRSQYYRGWDIGIPGGNVISSAATDAGYRKLQRGLVSVDYKLLPGSSAWIESKLHLYSMYIKREVLIENPNPSSQIIRLEPESENKTTGGQWTNTIQLDNNRLVAGVDSWLRTISTDRTKTNMTTNVLMLRDTPLPDAYYFSNGAFAEDDIKLNSFTVNFGGRCDAIFTGNDKVYKSEYPASTVVLWNKQNVYDYSWNGHAGLSYEILKDFTTGVLAASGYRAASLEERYKYIAVSTVEHRGNPDLDPERSWFFEYTLHYKNNFFKGNGSCYLNQLRDLISDQMITSTEYRLENVDRARIWGTEYDISVKPVDRLELYNNLSYTRGEDTKKNKDLPYIAPLRVITGIKVNEGYCISGFADVTWTAKQNKVPSGTDRSAGWFRLDAGLDYRFTTGSFKHKISVTCTNMLDNEYYDYLSVSKSDYKFNEPVRSVKCGYSVLF